MSTPAVFVWEALRSTHAPLKPAVVKGVRHPEESASSRNYTHKKRVSSKKSNVDQTPVYEIKFVKLIF